jgi:hypothetical protein
VTTSNQGEGNKRKVREPAENRCREARAPGMKGSQISMAMKGTNQGSKSRYSFAVSWACIGSEAEVEICHRVSQPL